MNKRPGLWIRIGAILFLFGTAVVPPIVAGTDYGPSLFTGSASYVIPIQTLPGKGVGPSLALQYDSGGGKSAYGWGWSLVGGGEISRVGNGFHRIPRFVDIDDPATIIDERDDFQLSMGGTSSDLKRKSIITGIPADDTFYVPTDEMFFRIRKDTTANGWIVSGPDGTTYEFLRPIYRVGYSSGFANARAWALSRVISSDGYSMDFTYDIDISGGD